MNRNMLLILGLFTFCVAFGGQVLEGGTTYRRTELTVKNIEVGLQGNANLCAIYAVDSAVENYSTHAYFDATTEQGKNLLTLALFLKQSGGKATVRFVVGTKIVLLNSVAPALSTNYKLIGILAK